MKNERRKVVIVHPTSRGEGIYRRIPLGRAAEQQDCLSDRLKLQRPDTTGVVKSSDIGHRPRA